MTQFTQEEFEELAEELRTTARALLPAIIDHKLPLLLVALEHMVAPVVTIETDGQWRGTAPLDGKETLGKNKDGRVCVVQYRKWRLGDDELADHGVLGWRETNTGRRFYPTRWMVIPEDYNDC